MEGIFDSTEITALPKIKQSDFNKSSIKVLEYIAKAYNDSWHKRRLEDGEFPDQSICDKCKGCGEFKSINGDVLECIQHYSEDDAFCYHPYQDAEEFGLEVQAIIVDVYSILGIQIVPDNIGHDDSYADRERD